MLGQPISSVMTRDPVKLMTTDRMNVVLNKMGVGEFRHVPVMDDDAVAGMVNATDVMRWVLLQYFG
jgi:CBS domain-containing protein